MQVVRICVYDEEESFACALAAILNRYGEGKYKAGAYTEIGLLTDAVRQQNHPILLSSDMALLQMMKKEVPNLVTLLLQESGEVLYGREPGIDFCVSKYAGAKKISNVMEQAISKIYCSIRTEHPVIAMFSPVGRCGKTKFALSLGCTEAKRRWLYVGMEEYGSVINDITEYESCEWQDELLYFIKERDTEKIMQILECCQGILPSIFSPFDGRQMTREDWEWIVDLMRKQSFCWGTVFDIGTGILQDIDWLDSFDWVLVPFLAGEPQKKEKFVRVLQAYGKQFLLEKMVFLDMTNDKEVTKQREKMIYGKADE